MARKPIWQLLQDCAREHTQNGNSPVTRGDLIACVQRTDPSIGAGSINPMIQGITDNLRGGAPGAVGKNILHSVGRGLFELRRLEAAHPGQPPNPATPSAHPISPVEHRANSNVTLPESEAELRDAILSLLQGQLRDIQFEAEGPIRYRLPCAGRELTHKVRHSGQAIHRRGQFLSDKH